ncbi:MAG TPA: histidine kinase [Marinobacter sp.]|uniref:Histidine kinase n=2 Tax=root TaxID=1 RepID=A0A831R3Y6_9GAMM|nr:cache domain-containing protein [Marinobacter antarcticus]HDZ37254.1 histidine kinase [Marinobacter sp.]HEA53553.1 histidine kinase [Marinobacter antarcticus]
MSLRTKLILLALVPLLVVTGIFSVVTLHQGDILTKRELQVFEQNLRRSKETALKDYVSIMRTAIDFIRQSSATDEEARKRVVALMQKASFSDDGYFYAYNKEGLTLVHATQPGLVGQDLYNFQDSSGNYLIQNLIRIAENGGGYYQYMWQQPTTGKEVDKVGYVEQIADWQWMFGTGLYIDDIATEMRLIEAGVDANVKQTLLAILASLLLAIGVIVSIGVLFNVHENRLADQNLKELSHKTVQHQEEERRRVSRELHDGINQLLVSVKYRLETAMTHIPVSESAAHESLMKGGEVLNRAIQEVRSISHDLRPSVLDDLGLMAALNQLLDDFRERSGIDLDIDIQSPQSDIAEEVATTLYRIVQEALSNIEKHARASKLVLSLNEDAEGLFLCITDNGVGIVEKDVYASRGIGLRNMRERVEFLGGEFWVSRRPGNGTRITASFKEFQA